MEFDDNDDTTLENFGLNDLVKMAIPFIDCDERCFLVVSTIGVTSEGSFCNCNYDITLTDKEQTQRFARLIFTFGVSEQSAA
jgi:hypothetical protein